MAGSEQFDAELAATEVREALDSLIGAVAMRYKLHPDAAKRLVLGVANAYHRTVCGSEMATQRGGTA